MCPSFTSLQFTIKTGNLRVADKLPTVQQMAGTSRLLLISGEGINTVGIYTFVAGYGGIKADASLQGRYRLEVWQASLPRLEGIDVLHLPKCWKKLFIWLISPAAQQR